MEHVASNRLRFEAIFDTKEYICLQTEQKYLSVPVKAETDT